MLDPNVLAQLNQLKTDIQASKDYAEGVVAATSGRFGFVRTDDGRDTFLTPEKMDRVLPGDRVKVSVIEKEKGKLEAELEKLISSDIKKFVGQYRVKGAGHFVVPGGTKFSRWIFVPPSQRKGAKDGDFVVAKMAKHPFKDGKAQANVIFLIGKPGDDHIEHKYTKAKYELNYRRTESYDQQAKQVKEKIEAADFSHLEDLSHIPFVTIDSASTLDMDDAIYAESSDEGWKLFVAIAAPSMYISAESAIGQQALTSGQSVYLLGGTVPMLPPQLAHYSFSLEENKVRPALVATMQISKEGEITACDFSKARVQSKHKLSYEGVAAFLENNAERSGPEPAVPSSSHENLTQLKLLSDARRNYREQNYLVSDDQADFDFKLDAKGHIESIQLRGRNLAQQVVEEAMIATNIEAGKRLSKAGKGLHMIHNGFREDRIGEVHALLKEEGCDSDDINHYDGHVKLMKLLASDSEKQKLIPALRRMMQASELSLEGKPHLGLGVPAYATVTSPIRRYADMFNHWCLYQLLDEQEEPQLSSETLESLNESLRNGRQADRELQQWLVSLFAKTLVGESAKGQVRIVTQQGFGVKLIDNGVEGFVLFDKKTEKTFDAKRMTLKVNERTFYIGDEVEIKIESVDLDKRRIAFSVVN